MSDHDVTNDLMKKVSDDVGTAILRTCDLAHLVEGPLLPILLSAAGTGIGMLGAELSRKPDGLGEEINNSLLLLAALLTFRYGMTPKPPPDPTAEAFQDLEALEKAGRIPRGTADGIKKRRR